MSNSVVNMHAYSWSGALMTNNKDKYIQLSGIIAVCLSLNEMIAEIIQHEVLKVA